MMIVLVVMGDFPWTVGAGWILDPRSEREMSTILGYDGVGPSHVFMRELVPVALDTDQAESTCSRYPKCKDAFELPVHGLLRTPIMASSAK